MFQLSCLRHFHYIISSVKGHDTYAPPGLTDEIQMDDNICSGTWRDEASSEFLCPLETTKQN